MEVVAILHQPRPALPGSGSKRTGGHGRVGLARLRLVGGEFKVVCGEGGGEALDIGGGHQQAGDADALMHRHVGAQLRAAGGGTGR